MKKILFIFVCTILTCLLQTELACAQGQDEKSVEKNKRIRQRSAGVGKSNGNVAYGQARKQGNGETARATYRGSNKPRNKNFERNLDDDRAVFSGTEKYVDKRKFKASKDNERAKHEGKISLKAVRKQDNNRYALNDANSGYDGATSMKKVNRFRANAKAIDDERATHEGRISLKAIRRQDNNRYALNEANAGYDGNISMRTIKKFRANAKAIDNQRASYDGEVAVKDLRKRDNDRYALNRDMAAYDGSISMRKINKFRAKAKAVDNERASYSGDLSVRKINRWKRDKDIKDYEMANYEGSVRIRVRDLKHPYRAIASRRTSIQNRHNSAKYNTQKLFARRVPKSQLANYQKEGPRKLKYGRGETEMWQTGAIAKRGEDGKVTTIKMRPNSRDDQRKELLQKSKAERREARKKGPKEERTGESIKNGESTPTPPPPPSENKE